MSFSQLLPRTRGGAKRLGFAISGKIADKRLAVRTASNSAEARLEEDRPASEDVEEDDAKYNFLPLKIKPDKISDRIKREYVDLTPPPRSTKMDPEQDWTNVWPTSGVFRHSVAPFPLRMGVVKDANENNFVVPDKSVNVELLKISNFLHLTPKHVEKHCEVLHQFCTEWPEGLETEEDFDKHFPVEVTTHDYVYSWSIRDERSKINEVKVKLAALHLDLHARDKIVRLAEGRTALAPDPKEEALKLTQIGIEGDTPMNLKKEATMATSIQNITWLNERKLNAKGELKWRRRYRNGWWELKKHLLHPEVHALQEDLPEKDPIADYDYETDKLVLKTQQCPTRKQNYDHAVFLLKALYGESWKHESWEDEKEPEDLPKFVWEKSGQREAGLKLYRSAHPAAAEKTDEEILASSPEVAEYRHAVEELVNYGERPERMDRYKAAVKKLLAIED